MYIICMMCVIKFCIKICDLIIEDFLMQGTCNTSSSFSQICWKDSYEC